MLGDIDMSKPLSIRDNIKKSKIITLSSIFIGTIIFLIAYLITNDIWLLALTIVMVISALFFWYVIAKFEEKFANEIKDEQHESTNTQIKNGS